MMNKTKEYIWRASCALAFLTFTLSQAKAQETTVMDTINVDELAVEKPLQIPLERCRVMDICEGGRYAIVAYHGKRGIYDLFNEENVTEIDMDEVGFSRHVVAEDSIHIYYFRAEKGLQSGIIGVIGSNNQTLGIWMDNPELVASLSECTTIDEEISRKCNEVLKETMQSLSGRYGQVAVLDAQTGHLKAWVALEKDTTGVADGKLLKKSCSACLFAPVVAASRLAKAGIPLSDSVDTSGEVCADGDSFVIWEGNQQGHGSGRTSYSEALARKSPVAMFKAITSGNSVKGERIWREITSGKKEANAMELAAVTNFIYHLEELRIPTLEGDSIKTVDMSELGSVMKECVRTIIAGINSGNGCQAGIAPKGIDVAGLYGKNSQTDKMVELSYAGCFPADNPRYAIGLFIDSPTEEDVTENVLSRTVNKLIEWLNGQ